MIAVHGPSTFGHKPICEAAQRGPDLTDMPLIIVRADQMHLVTCPWCLGARNQSEAKRIIADLKRSRP